MLLLGFYTLFLTVLSVLGYFVGLAANTMLPGWGSIVTVMMFMLALWFGWLLAVKVTERYWPEQPEAQA